MSERCWAHSIGACAHGNGQRLRHSSHPYEPTVVLRASTWDRALIDWVRVVTRLGRQRGSTLVGSTAATSTGSPKSKCVAVADATLDDRVQDENTKKRSWSPTKERHMAGEDGNCCCNRDDRHDKHDHHGEGSQAPQAPVASESAGCCGGAAQNEGTSRSNGHAQHAESARSAS